MNPIARRKANQREAAIKSDADKETARQIALAVSIALKKAEREAASQNAE